MSSDFKGFNEVEAGMVNGDACGYCPERMRFQLAGALAKCPEHLQWTLTP